MNTLSMNLADFGWRPALQQQLSFDEMEQCVAARVTAVYRDRVHVLAEHGELDIPIAGVLDSPEPEQRATVGDWLLLDANSHKVIRLLERNNVLQRTAAGTERKSQLIAANIDTLFIVSSCNVDFNPSRLERYLSLAMAAHIPTVIVLTKADLCREVDHYQQKAQALHVDVPVITLNALNTDVAEVLKAWLGKGQTVAFVGSSGVGKSTLTNSLMGVQVQSTQGIREDDAKGRHTTTGRHLFALPSGGWVLDTPGMRELRLGEDAFGVAEVFADIELLMTQCRFNNCHHSGDLGCAVTAAIQNGELDERRWHNYLKLSEEAELASQTKAERVQAKDKWAKDVSKFSRQHKKNKPKW